METDWEVWVKLPTWERYLPFLQNVQNNSGVPTWLPTQRVWGPLS